MADYDNKLIKEYIDEHFGDEIDYTDFSNFSYLPF
jgi:hypothetical protein